MDMGARWDMITGTAMTTADAARLKLVQWLSPGFPVSGYAYSHGLEAAMVSGAVAGGDSLGRWLGDVLIFGSGRSDAILLALALKGGNLAELSDLAAALAASRERRAETMDQGAAFVATVNAIDGRDLPPLAYPVAVGAAARGLGLAAPEVAAVYLHAFAATLVQAAVRFIPLGQTAGQAVLACLHPAILAVAAEAAAADLSDLGGAAFGSDLAAMRHETLEVRIFRT